MGHFAINILTYLTDTPHQYSNVRKKLVLHLYSFPLLRDITY